MTQRDRNGNCGQGCVRVPGSGEGRDPSWKPGSQGSADTAGPGWTAGTAHSAENQKGEGQVNRSFRDCGQSRWELPKLGGGNPSRNSCRAADGACSNQSAGKLWPLLSAGQGAQSQGRVSRVTRAAPAASLSTAGPGFQGGGWWGRTVLGTTACSVASRRCRHHSYCDVDVPRGKLCVRLGRSSRPQTTNI